MSIINKLITFFKALEGEFLFEPCLKKQYFNFLSNEKFLNIDDKDEKFI